MNIIQIISEPFINFLQAIVDGYLVDQEANAKLIIISIIKNEDIGIIFLVLGILFTYIFIFYKYKKNSIKKILNLKSINLNYSWEETKREISFIKQDYKAYSKELFKFIIRGLDEFKYVQASLSFITIATRFINFESLLLQFTLLSISLLEIIFLGIFCCCLIVYVMKEIIKGMKYLLPLMTIGSLLIVIIDSLF